MSEQDWHSAHNWSEASIKEENDTVSIAKTCQRCQLTQTVIYSWQNGTMVKRPVPYQNEYMRKNYHCEQRAKS